MIYSFTLAISGIDTTRSYEDKLYEAGCSDALIAVVDGTVYLDFDREALSFAHAVNSAIDQVTQVILDAD
jgi:hypothetical protein